MYDLKDLITQLEKTREFASCHPMALARIVPHVTERRIKEGDTLFQEGLPAKELYFILEGKIRLVSGKRAFTYFNKTRDRKERLLGRPVQDQMEEGFLGEETSVSDNVYRSNAIASTPSRVMVIPQESLLRLLDRNSDVKKELQTSLINHYSTQKWTPENPPDDSSKAPGAWKSVGWLLAIIIPAIVMILGTPIDIDIFGVHFNNESLGLYFPMEDKLKHFLTILSATIVMWVFQLTHEFVPTIFAVLSILILGLVPSKVALSGFTSGSFVMAMSIFGLSVVLVSSGFAFRVVLNILRFVPRSQFWYSFTIFLTGFLVTPIFPSANGRVTLATPILSDMVESLGYEKKGKASTSLSVATFAGFTLFSGVFLSSKSINFVIYGLLPKQVQNEFTWSHWTLAAAVVGVVLLVAYFILSQIMFRNKEKPQLSKEQVKVQLDFLGPMNSREWAALGSIVLFIVGIATSSIHKIQLPLIGLSILYVILSLEFLGKKEFQKNIDWTFLIYLATLIGLVTTMKEVGLNKEIIKLFQVYPLNEMGKMMISDFPIFVLLLSASIFIVRLVIPNNATAVIFASIFLPIAGSNGANPWVIGFIILVISDGWMMGYQSTYYLLFKNLTAKNNFYNPSRLLLFFFLINFARVGAVLISIPFWKELGIL